MVEILTSLIITFAGSYSPNLDSNHLNPHANHSVISLHEKSVKTRDQPLRTVFKLGKIRCEEICVQDKSPGSCDLQGEPSVVKSGIFKDVEINKLAPHER